MYRLPDNADGTRPTKDLEWFFDCLEGTIRKCPAESCAKRLTLAAILVHLNDDHRWTREQIATWLEDEKANGRLTAARPPTT